MKFSVDTNEMRMLGHHLRRLNESVFPTVTQNTINSMAFEAQREGKRQTRLNFTLRNQFTVQGVQVEQSRTNIIARQASEMGTAREYMRVQEEGGVKSGKNGAAVNLLTNYGSGEPEGTTPRKKLAVREHRHSNLRINRESNRGRTEKQRNAIKIKQAAANGMGFVYLKTAKRKGIYRVWGNESNPVVKMVWDLSKRSVRIPKHGWFEPARIAGIESRDRHFRRSMQFELRKAKIRY